MRIDDYKLVVEVNTLDNKILLYDINTKIYDLNLIDLEDYAIKYNGIELCSGSCFSTTLTIVFDGDVYEIHWDNTTTFKTVIQEVSEIAANHLKNISSNINRIKQYADACDVILNFKTEL